jgi:chaperone required for assembly of F1-ATPase
MKRVYRAVAVAPGDGGWQVMLDSRLLRTPAKAPLLLPNCALAEAVAAEWDAQVETVVPATMPLMRLAATAIDRVVPQRARVIDEVAGYAGTDLVCYRADRPAELVARQQAIWQPLVDWATLRYDAPLLVTTGVVPRPQPAGVVAAIHAAVAAFDDFSLTALHGLTTACGSVVIALALADSHLQPEAAWQASQLDETYQIENWGEDAEARRRRAAIRADIEDSCRFLALLRSG